jgi:hypothetical protein
LASPLACDRGRIFHDLFYGAASYVFIYVYDKMNIRGWYTFVYVAAWALISAGAEYVAVLFHVFTYKTWNVAYSFLFYLVVQHVTVAFYLWMKGLYARLRMMAP